MLRQINEREFQKLLARNAQYSSTHAQNFLKLFVAITMRWNGLLYGPRLSVLAFVAGRTLMLGKAHDWIALREFSSGTEEDISTAGLDISERSVGRHLHELCEMDFIHIYYSPASNGAEKDCRIYEINCEKLLAGDELTQLADHLVAQRCERFDKKKVIRRVPKVRGAY